MPPFTSLLLFNQFTFTKLTGHKNWKDKCHYKNEYVDRRITSFPFDLKCCPFSMPINHFTVATILAAFVVQSQSWLTSLWPHGLQHTRLPCPSLAPEACSNSCPSSRWRHPTISCSVVPFSSRLQSFPVTKSFLMSQSAPCIRKPKVLELQFQHQSFQWIFRTDFL